jgi:hypothetical protein
MKALDLANQRFGRLTVIKRGAKDNYGRYMWLCRCDCGNEKPIHGRHLVQGKSSTCGCGIGRTRHKPHLGVTGTNHPKWKGGLIIRDGYKYVYVAPYTYKAEHRLVAGLDENSSLVVHHKNHNKQDNRPENLVCMTRKDHANEHQFGKIIRRTK